MKTELNVPSELNFLIVVENWLLDSLKVAFGDSVDWKSQTPRLRLALAEAYSNVVRHAHRDQPNLPILFRLEVKDRDVALEIWDRGNGYNISNYIEPSPEEKQESGYGWLIMQRLMDRVEYRLQVNGLNCLKLETSLPKLEE
jgi:serine/threonine-protein kinase RsbW